MAKTSFIFNKTPRSWHIFQCSNQYLCCLRLRRVKNEAKFTTLFHFSLYDFNEIKLQIVTWWQRIRVVVRHFVIATRYDRNPTNSIWFCKPVWKENSHLSDGRRKNWTVEEPHLPKCKPGVDVIIILYTFFCLKNSFALHTNWYRSSMHIQVFYNLKLSQIQRSVKKFDQFCN